MSERGGRTDRWSLVIEAPAGAVFDALVDPVGVARWLPPAGMDAVVDAWEARPGGAVHVTLRYAAPDDVGSGKTSADTDVVRGRFTEVVHAERLVLAVEFDADDPALAGTMTMTWSLRDEPGGVRVTVEARDVPDGIGRADHEAGLRSTLEQLAAYVAA